MPYFWGGCITGGGVGWLTITLIQTVKPKPISVKIHDAYEMMIFWVESHDK